jgi:hypothetical protein
MQVVGSTGFLLSSEVESTAGGVEEEEWQADGGYALYTAPEQSVCMLETLTDKR